MNRIFSLTTALIISASAYAQAIYQPGQHDNIVTIAVNNAEENLNMFPLDLVLTNPTVSIGSVNAYLYIDDNTVRPWIYDDDEEDYAFDRNSSRTYKNTNFKFFVCEEDNPTHPGHFFVNAVEEKNFKLNDGPIVTFYMDATMLTNGNHTIHVVEPMCSYANADGSESASYFSAEHSINFNISGGTLTILNGIDALSQSTNHLELFDLQGRHLTHMPNKGIILHKGKKIIR